MATRNIHILIKAQKLHVDAQRRLLADCQAEADALAAAIARLETSLKAEAEAAAMAGSTFMLGAFIKKELQRKAALHAALERKNGEAEALRATLLQLFAEQKRYELTQAQWDAAAKAKKQKMTQQQLDEQASGRHQRKT